VACQCKSVASVRSPGRGRSAGDRGTRNTRRVAPWLLARWRSTSTRRDLQCRSPTDQHHLALPSWLCPGSRSSSTSDSAPPGASSRSGRRCPGGSGRTCPQHTIHLGGRRDTLEAVGPQLLGGKVARTRRKVPILTTTVSGAASPGGVQPDWASPQCQLFLAAAAPDLAHNHQSSMDPYPYSQLDPRLLLQAAVERPMACTMSSPVRTAAAASSSCACDSQSTPADHHPDTGQCGRQSAR